jgi:hypothetical protein
VAQRGGSIFRTSLRVCNWSMGGTGVVVPCFDWYRYIYLCGNPFVSFLLLSIFS